MTAGPECRAHDRARHVAPALLGLLAWWAAGAAASGHDGAPASLYEQARALEHGEGVGRDPLAAAERYCAAIRQGDVDAMHALGWMYAFGRGVARNDSLASTLFAMAAFTGHAQSGAMLAHVGPHQGEVPACLIVPPMPPAAPPAEWSVADFVANQPPERRHYAELVARLAPDFDIEPRLALAVAQTESAFDPSALSGKNAAGLMQLIPETAERFHVRDAYDPQQNVRGGLAYLRWLLAYFRGDVTLAVAGYNAGERAVDRYRGVPPYRETRDYVARVLAFYPRLTHRFREGIAEASPALAAMRHLAGKGRAR